jgi:hypothetical protein
MEEMAVEVLVTEEETGVAVRFLSSLFVCKRISFEWNIRFLAAHPYQQNYILAPPKRQREGPLPARSKPESA